MSTRRPDAERFEIRSLPGCRSGVHLQDDVVATVHTWHRSRHVAADRAAALAQSDAVGDVWVVWTHPEDGWSGPLIDNAMVVWESCPHKR